MIESASWQRVRRAADRLKEGQDALARDDPAAAARLLADALGLWRGLALADFAFDSFAQVDIARLASIHRLHSEPGRVEPL